MTKIKSKGGPVGNFLIDFFKKNKPTRNKKQSKSKSYKSNTDQCDKLRKCCYINRMKRIA
ncbi:hypothetical protein GW791_02875 [Candidatus Saccharibacteria bacterium]|nr:hypothetical protein [Candidatus Saccharibacteria bacterium]